MKLSNKLFIHAPNVHQGGGASLLNALVQAVTRDVVLSVDERMHLPNPQKINVQVKRIVPSILRRLLAEKWLMKAVEKDDVVLCFGNLPPLFRLRGRTIVFLQNRYLLEHVPLNDFSLKDRIRLSVERLWLTHRLSNADEFVVQTPTMKNYLEVKTRGTVPVQVKPFVMESNGYSRNFIQQDRHNSNAYDFVYVASGEPHKNHHNLLEAWCLLSKEGLFPSLCLTLDEVQFPEICIRVEAMKSLHGVKIINVGRSPYEVIWTLYKKSGAVIYPSKFESFGMPLVEARQAGLPVLASELDYVRDVLDPEQVFDPNSPISIARAVKRFMGLEEMSLPLLDATRFISSMLYKDI